MALSGLLEVSRGLDEAFPDNFVGVPMTKHTLEKVASCAMSLFITAVFSWTAHNSCEACSCDTQFTYKLVIPAVRKERV